MLHECNGSHLQFVFWQALVRFAHSVAWAQRASARMWRRQPVRVNDHHIRKFSLTRCQSMGFDMFFWVMLACKLSELTAVPTHGLRMSQAKFSLMKRRKTSQSRYCCIKINEIVLSVKHRRYEYMRGYRAIYLVQIFFFGENFTSHKQNPWAETSPIMIDAAFCQAKKFLQICG